MVPEQFGGLEARTLDTGTDDSGLGKRMGLGKLFGKKGDAEEVGRRDVLRGAGKAGIAVAGAHLGGLGFSNEAEAKRLQDVRVPIGYKAAGQRDAYIETLFRLIVADETLGEYDNRKSKEVARLKIIREGIGKHNPYSEELPNLSSYHTEPAIWDSAGKLERKNEVYSKVISERELRKKNPAMFLFAEGINWFYRYWDREDNGNYQGIYVINNFIDGNLGASMVAAAGRKNPMKEYKNFRFEMSNEEQRRYLENLFEDLKKRDEVQKRTAEWASYWLVNNFVMQNENQEEEKTMILLNKIIEVPLRNYVERIRREDGEPYYFQINGQNEF